MTKIKVAILLVSPGKAGVESVVGNIIKFIDKDKIEFFLINSSEIAPYYQGLIPSERHLVLGKYFNTCKNNYLKRGLDILKRKLKLNERKLEKWAKWVET
ncbi:MAG: hypothetical protein ACKVQB_12920, partial [Bacteroidia bacterium]